jgi:uncharacterized protein
MSATLDPIGSAKTVVLRSYKRDGTAVATPVSIAFAGGRAFFRSYDRAWKARRLRNNPSVEVAPSTFRGRVTGTTVHADAKLLRNGDADVAAEALARRHPILQGMLVPIAHRLKGYETLHYELTARGGPPK